MKTRFATMTMAIVFAVSLFQCSEKKAENATEEHAAHASGSEASEATTGPQFQVDANFQQQLGDVYTSYISLKDAFVASDAEKVKSAATAVAQSLAKVDMKLLTGVAHNDWMAYLAPMESSLKDISASGDLEAQRKQFSTVSDNLYKSIKAFGLGGKEAFYEYCPMAFNNEGAYWLSDSEEIRNPYFGDMMLTCGKVKEKLK